MSPTYTLSAKAYVKLFFHAAKHPHKPVNGVLLGTQIAPGSPVEIEDAVPLLHHWTSLSPMMEIGLDMATQYAESHGQKLVGYYQACERLDDTALAPVGERVASKLRESFSDTVAFVIDGEKIGTGSAGLVPYLSLPASPSTWRPVSDVASTFAPNSPFQLASQDLPMRASTFVRNDHAHLAFGDFDDHLEDVTIDWLRNSVCLPTEL